MLLLLSKITFGCSYQSAGLQLMDQESRTIRRKVTGTSWRQRTEGRFFKKCSMRKVIRISCLVSVQRLNFQGIVFLSLLLLLFSSAENQTQGLVQVRGVLYQWATLPTNCGILKSPTSDKKETYDFRLR